MELPACCFLRFIVALHWRAFGVYGTSNGFWKRSAFGVSAKGGVQQDNVEDFIADRFQQIRDDNRSIRDRVYFVENLRKQYPNPGKDHLHNLRMLGRETLPVRVKTAIEQAVDAGERSSARSRLHAEMDETLFKQRVEDYWKKRRKLILPPVIARTLYVLVVGSLLVSLATLFLYWQRSTDRPDCAARIRSRRRSYLPFYAHQRQISVPRL